MPGRCFGECTLRVSVCHRVVGSEGSLTGYAGGVAKKELLLALEGDMEKLSMLAKGMALQGQDMKRKKHRRRAREDEQFVIPPCALT